MSRYFNDFGAMHGESLEHKAYKYVKKVKTKNGKTRYVYAKTAGSVAKNIATNPQKYGAARMEELSPEELRRFSGKAHMDKLEIDEMGPNAGYENLKKAVKHPDGDIIFYDKRYNIGRSGTRLTLSPKNGNLTKDGKYVTPQGYKALDDANRMIGKQYAKEDLAAAKKKMQKDKKAFDKKYKQTKKAMKKRAK